MTVEARLNSFKGGSFPTPLCYRRRPFFVTTWGLWRLDDGRHFGHRAPPRLDASIERGGDLYVFIANSGDDFRRSDSPVHHSYASRAHLPTLGTPK